MSSYADELVDAYYAIHPDEYPAGDQHRARQDAAHAVAAKVLRDLLEDILGVIEDDAEDRIREWASQHGISLGEKD